MNERDMTLSRHVKHALEARGRSGIPGHVDLWPYLQQATRDQPRPKQSLPLFRSGRRVLLIAAVCVMLITGGIAAASPALRQFLPGRGAGEMMDRRGDPLLIAPLPRFPLFYPKVWPRGLTVRVLGQFNNPKPQSGGFLWYGAPDCRKPSSHCSQVLPSFLRPQPTGLGGLLEPFNETSTDIVLFGRADVPPGPRFIELVEWDAATSSVRTLGHTDIPPHTAIIVVTRGHTRIGIETNLGTAAARQVAASLRPLTVR